MGRIEHTLLDGEFSVRPNRPKTFARNPLSTPPYHTKLQMFLFAARVGALHSLGVRRKNIHGELRRILLPRTPVNRLSVDASHHLRWHHACGGYEVAGTHPSSPGRRVQCLYSSCSGGKETPRSSLLPTIESLSVPFPASNLSAYLTPVREPTMA